MFYFFITLIIFPALIFLFTKNIETNLRVGFILIAITPVGITSSILVKVLEGDIELSLISIILFNIISIFSYPLIIKLLFNSQEIHIPISKTITNLFLLIFIPFVLSIIIKKIKKVTPTILFLSKYTNYLLSMIIFIAVSSSSGIIRKYSLKEISLIFAITFFIALSYFGLGLILGKNSKIKKTLSITLGQKNTGLCIWVSLTYFSPITVLPATVYIIIHHLLNSILILIFLRLKKGQSNSSLVD